MNINVTVCGGKLEDAREELDKSPGMPHSS